MPAPWKLCHQSSFNFTSWNAKLDFLPQEVSKPFKTLVTSKSFSQMSTDCCSPRQRGKLHCCVYIHILNPSEAYTVTCIKYCTIGHSCRMAEICRHCLSSAAWSAVWFSVSLSVWTCQTEHKWISSGAKSKWGIVMETFPFGANCQ